MASCLAKSSTTERCRPMEGDFVIASLQHYAKLGHWNVHHTGWSFQRNIHAWDNLAFSVGISTTKDLLRPFILLKSPWVLVDFTRGDEEKQSVCYSDGQLYSLEASTTGICEESFSLVGHLLPTASTALRPLTESFPEDVCTAVLSFGMYSMAENND